MTKPSLRPLLWGASILVLALAAALVLGRHFLRPALGFAAKGACSGVLVGGASLEQVREGFPDPRLRELVRVRLDADGSGARAWLPGLGARRAAHRDGLGCSLLGPGTALAPIPLLPPTRAGRSDPRGTAGEPWPLGEALSPLPPEVDEARLEAALARAFAESPGQPLRRTHAVVVVHGGRLVAERYAPGYSGANRFPGWSMAKSVTSALAGILVGEGALRLDERDLRPEWRGSGDPRAEITVEHLLQMTSGLDFDERYTPTGGATLMLFDSPDAAAFAARSRLDHDPGTSWSYSSGTTNLLSAHLRSRIEGGDSAYARFPRRALFDPIGMSSAVFEPDPSGTFVGSSFLYATARDWARFGLLFLNDGVWEGARILPEGWVGYSTTPAPPAPRGRYGAHWWLNRGPAGAPEQRVWQDLPPDLFWASGFQGQYVVVAPSHDLVLVRLGLAEVENAFDLGGLVRDVLAAFPTRTAERERSPGSVAAVRQ